MMDTALEKSQHLDIDLTLTWCINAKNSPANVYGFYLFQLVFGKNTKLPFTFNNKPSALIQHDTSKILTDNLTALYKTKTSIYFKQIIRENTKSFKQQ